MKLDAAFCIIEIVPINLDSERPNYNILLYSLLENTHL